MADFIKGNSCLFAVDSSPAFKTGESLGLYFLSLLENVDFSISPARTQTRQIGGQEFGVDCVNFSPDIIANLSYSSRQDFDSESLLGTVFRPSGDYRAIFSGINDFSFNGYLFFSDSQGYDLIKQIQDSSSFSGVNVVSLGNCYLTNASHSFSAGELAKTACQFVASNIVSESLTGNRMQIPAINLESGTTGNAATIFLNPLQVNRLPTGGLTGILPNIWTARFKPSFESLQIPNQKLDSWNSAHVQNMELSLSIDRENVYGFGSDHVYGRDVKFPVQGSISINGLVSDYQTGSFEELMRNERKQTIEIFYRDPKDEFLSGLSLAEFSGLNETGHIVKNRWLKFDNCVLREKRDSLSANGMYEFSAQFDFGATENGGFSYKQGDELSVDDFVLRSSDLRRLVSSDGYSIITDPFCRAYGNNCEVETILSADGRIMCTRDNFVFEGSNPVCYLPPNLPSGVFALYLSLTDGSSGSFVPLAGFPASGAGGGYLQSGTRVYYNYSPTFLAPSSGELLDSTATGDFPNLFYKMGAHKFQYSGGYGIYNLDYNFDNEISLSPPSITGSGYSSNQLVGTRFSSGNHHIVEIHKSADGTGSFTGINARGVFNWTNNINDTAVTGQSIYYYKPVGIRGATITEGLITGYPNPRTSPSGLYFDEGFSTFNEQGTLRWSTGMRPAQSYQYNIYRSLSGSTPFSLIGSTTGLSYTDSTMIDPGVYIFRATVSINGFESPTGSSSWTWIESY